MKKIFTFVTALLLASSLSIKAEEVTVYICDKEDNDIAYDFDADLTKDADGVYTLTNLFGVDEGYGIPFSFKFTQPEVGKTSPIEVTSNTTEVEGMDGCYYIKNSNDKHPIFWVYDLNGIEDYVKLRKSYIDLGNGESYVYRYDTSDPENKYEYVVTLKISGTFNGYNSETDSYDKELFTGEGETAPWLYLEFWFNDPTTDDPIDEPTVEVLRTIDVTVDVDEAYYFPDYSDSKNYSEKVIKSFDAKLDFMSDGTYKLKDIFGTDNYITYTAGNFNPKNVAKVTYTGNIYTYYGSPYFLTPDGEDFISFTVEEENGEKIEVEDLYGYENVEYTYVYKTSEAEIAEGYYQYYVYLYVKGYVGEDSAIDLSLAFGYNDTSTGVTNVEASEKAPVEYYNLQGVKVADPSNGIFIRHQGNKVSKISIK